MGEHDLTTHEGQAARLDAEYIARAGRLVRRALDGHRAPLRYGPTWPLAWPVGFAYAPGNGTSYSLVFVPVAAIDQLGPELGERDAWAVPPGSFGSVRACGLEVPYSGHVLLAKCNGTASDFAAVFDLSPGTAFVPGDVAERTGLGLADACALTALLRAVADLEAA